MIRTTMAATLAAAALAAGVTSVAGPAPAAHASLYCLDGYQAVFEVDAKTGVYDAHRSVGSPSALIKWKYPRDIVRGLVYNDNQTMVVYLGRGGEDGIGFMSLDKMHFLTCERS